MSVRTGLEIFIEAHTRSVEGQRLGLLCNQASVSSRLESAVDLFATQFGPQLTAIFTPQHGLWGEEQANMIETGHATHARLGIPVYSLYSETRRPTAAMLDEIDCLVVDLQDVGTRVYTFIWTLLACMQACEQAGKRVLVLDRPNPLGGQVSEGPMLVDGLQSFVGNSPIPLRHGLTIGELARLFHSRHTPALELECIAMQGWSREQLFADTGLPWVWPSPNMQRFETAVVYPGQVLLEGTNLSEGRGTTLPFEVLGAPYIDDPQRLCGALQSYRFPGVCLRPLRFRPVFDKWSGESCGGMQIHVLDPRQVRSVSLTLALLHVVREQVGEQFAWLPPPYEYEFNKLPIDILLGAPAVRTALEAGKLVERAAIEQCIRPGMADWEADSRKVWLYPARSGK
jgi:uncharacterized protein YbbC (DUF1343 family)